MAEVLEWIRFGVAAALMLFGLAVLCIGVFGVYRFHYVLNRMHAAAMNDTLGILFMISGLIVISGVNLVSLKLLLIILMLWLTSPVSSHLIGRLEVSTNEDIAKRAEVRKL